eukprot:357479-Chlamydomonas_euryale.AAC.4
MAVHTPHLARQAPPQGARGTCKHRQHERPRHLHQVSSLWRQLARRNLRGVGCGVWGVEAESEGPFPLGPRGSTSWEVPYISVHSGHLHFRWPRLPSFLRSEAPTDFQKNTESWVAPKWCIPV